MLARSSEDILTTLARRLERVPVKSNHPGAVGWAKSLTHRSSMRTTNSDFAHAHTRTRGHGARDFAWADSLAGRAFAHPLMSIVKPRLCNSPPLRKCCSGWQLRCPSTALKNTFMLTERLGAVPASFRPRVSRTASRGFGTDPQLRRDALDRARCRSRDCIPCPG